MKTLYLDIETGPLPEKDLLAMIPAFDPDAVKVGNIKDPDKIKARIAMAEERHGRDFLDNAALSALTGEVLCVGLLEENGAVQVFGNETGEATMLSLLWELLGDHPASMGGMALAGWCICGFDLPFLIRRSMVRRVAFPGWLRHRKGAKSHWSDSILDLQIDWKMDDFQSRPSLDDVAKFLGLPGKTGSGADFHKLWSGDRAAALAYLKNDLEQTRAVHRIMLGQF